MSSLFRRAPRNQIKTLAPLALLSGLLVALGYLVVGGPTGIIIGLVIAALGNFSSWYFSDKIALSADRAQPVTRDQAPVGKNHHPGLFAIKIG